MNTKRIIGIIGILISVFALYYISKKIDLNKAFEEFKTVNPIYIVLLSAIYITTYYFRTLRWKLMLANFTEISFNTFMQSVIVGFAGNNMLPARGGEIVRMAFFNRKTGVSKLTTLSSIFAERILDGLILVIIMMISLYLIPSYIVSKPWLGQTAQFVTIFFSACFLVIIIFKIYGTHITKFFESKKGKLIALLTPLLYKISDSLQFLRFDTNTLKIFIYSFIIWIIEGAVFSLAFYLFNLDLKTIFAGYLCLTIVNFGMLVPSSPAYIGIFQGMTILTLKLFGIDETKALSVGVFIHLCQFLPVTIWGIIIIIRNSIRIL